MRVLLVIMLAAVPVFANMEIVPCGSDTDLLFVSWISNTDDACLARYEGSSLSYQTSFSDRVMASVGVCDDESDSYHVLFVTSEESAFYDSLYTLHPVSLTVQDIVAVDRGVTETAQYGLLKYPDERWDGFLTGFYYTYFSSGVAVYWFTSEFDVAIDGSISMGTFLFEEDPYPLKMMDDPFTNRLVGPVTCLGGWPVFATDMHYPGYPFPPTPGWTLLTSFVHNPPVDPLNLLSDEFCYAVDTLAYDPCVMAFGSCSDRGLLMWADEYDVVLYSDFDCTDPVPLSTQTYQWNEPSRSSPCAMSGNPVDEGLLMAWYHAGEIRCRHYQGEWNAFDHIIQTGVGAVAEENISVCSVADGYRVAWLSSGADYPELVFVARDSVTGTENRNESVSYDLSVQVSPNPCYGCLNISLTGISAESTTNLKIYDAAGRLVRTISNTNGSVLWDCCDSDGNHCGQGMYFVRLTAGGQILSEKVVLLR